MKTLMIVVAIASLALIADGCASTHARETTLDREAKVAALEPQDVRRVVDKMVDSMLADEAFLKQLNGERPVLDVVGIKNKTTMHLETSSITSSIRTKFIRSRHFRFVDRETAVEDRQIMDDQANMGLVDPAKAIKPGQQMAAQMYLYGELNEMRSLANGITDRYFKLTLNMKDLRTGEIVWSDEQEIRKEQKHSVFGF